MKVFIFRKKSILIILAILILVICFIPKNNFTLALSLSNSEVLNSSFKDKFNSLYKSNEKHLVTPVKWEDCKVGDVVFCKVRGSCVTHKVYAVDNEKGCLIGNNKGHMNGWTKNVYGLAHKIDQSLKTKKA